MGEFTRERHAQPVGSEIPEIRHAQPVRANIYQIPELGKAASRVNTSK
jgi:hypothetical protein